MADSHIELPGSRRPLAKGARRMRELDPQSRIEVTLTLKAPPLPEADAISDESMTAEALAEQYGAAPADIARVVDVLGTYGLRAEPTDGRRSLRVSGTAAAVQAAFGANLAVYRSTAQGEFRGREGTLQIPAELEGLVTGVFGLDQRRVARRKAAGTATIAARASVPLGPSDLESHYDFPAGDCAGQSVAIAEFGAPMTNGVVIPPAYFPDDVAAFCKAQGRPVPHVKTVPVDIAPLTRADLKGLPKNVVNVILKETIEVMMDVEIVAALCPKAAIAVYYASFDEKGWVDLLDKVIAARPVALSISYGLAEDSPDWSAGALKAINDRLQAAAMVGITVCVSAGDDGSGCNQPGTRVHVDFPASSPFVLAVGGTMMQRVAGVTRETVWFESPGRRTKKGGGATGGGVSVLFPRPAWQTVKVASLNAGSISGRVVPDIAALAGPPKYELTFLGRSKPNGGTSASAPLLASLIARINAALPRAKQQRFLTRLLYQPGPGGVTIGAAGCTDITSGDNGSHPHPGKGYKAGKGFDAVTGWGVPSGKALLKALS